MGCCASSIVKCEEAVIEIDDCSMMKEKIEKVFRFSPLHKFGSRRQAHLLKEFLDYQIKNKQKHLLISFFYDISDTQKKSHSPNKIFNDSDRKMLKFTYELLEKNLNHFVNSELLFLHIILFVLSNTKNNIDHKQDIILEIINDVFFLNKNERSIDMEKLKQYIKSLINVCLTIFINFIVLNVFEGRKEIDKLLDGNYLLDDKYDKYKLTDYIFDKIKTEIKKPHSYVKLLSTWEDYLLGPIIFAGYSNEKNISNYNLKLKDEIIRRLADIFDSEKIIRSIVKMDIEMIVKESEE